MNANISRSLVRRSFRNLVRRLLPRLSKRLWKKTQQIGRNQRIFADGFAGQISREPVEIDSHGGRLQRMVGMLRNQSCDHSCENVSGSARRHTWIARGIHPHRAIG